MHELTKLIRDDMVPALGVTEPGAIAFCVAKARTLIGGELKHLHVAMNSGMYKNAFTCGIPNSEETGTVFAAALGYVAGNAERGLEALAELSPEDSLAAEALVRAGRVSIELSGITSRIFIEARLETTEGTAGVTIRDRHTNITKMTVNGETVFVSEEENGGEDSAPEAGGEHLIHRYTFAQILDYVNTVPAEEIAFVQEAYTMNLALFREGLESPRTTFARKLRAMNGCSILSGDELRTASLLCNGAIEARVMGLDKPAMSITGSGAHGIIATLPLYAVCRINRIPEEKLHRATMLSYLICTYIKEYSGRLSAFCGCGIAAGTGMAVAVCYLKGDTPAQMEYVLNNMASSITGMICDGGNQGCTMKGVVACAAAFESVALALGGVHIDSRHGINGETPEQTMRNMGLIASPGMVMTEETIVGIQESKSSQTQREDHVEVSLNNLSRKEPRT
ncbi:MAG: serine dehydratase subunit alpha family protein [Oscillospiraceae bacterium]|nr:serine dehydratase subunit alpha family protein [Oscillospiraceae bacterium]